MARVGGLFQLFAGISSVLLQKSKVLLQETVLKFCRNGDFQKVQASEAIEFLPRETHQSNFSVPRINMNGSLWGDLCCNQPFIHLMEKQRSVKHCKTSQHRMWSKPAQELWKPKCLALCWKIWTNHQINGTWNVTWFQKYSLFLKKPLLLWAHRPSEWEHAWAPCRPVLGCTQVEGELKCYVSNVCPPTANLPSKGGMFSLKMEGFSSDTKWISKILRPKPVAHDRNVPHRPTLGLWISSQPSPWCSHHPVDRRLSGHP